MKRAAVAATAIGILALTTGGPAEQLARIGLGRAYLPHVSQRRAPALIDVPAPRPVYRPATAGALIDALTVPRALVLPEPGEYWIPVQARLAAGVTVDGRGRVTITGHGLMIEDADGATVAGVEVTRVKGDCVTVKRSQRVLLERVRLSRASDGLLDMYGGATVTVRDSVLENGEPRGLLCGNWQAALDGRERLTLERVTFLDVPVRTPKLDGCDLIALDLTIIRPVEWGLDLRGSSTARITRLRIVYGRKTRAPGWRADDGARIVIDGEVR